MANFTGTLNTNKIYAAIFNMIISQRVFGDNMIMIIEWIEMSCFSCIRVMIYIDKFTF